MPEGVAVTGLESNGADLFTRAAVRAAKCAPCAAPSACVDVTARSAARVAWPNGMEGGEIRGQPVSENYQPPFAYAGTIKKVPIYIAPAAFSTGDREKVRNAERRAAMAIE
jgi:hypothetical protein